MGIDYRNSIEDIVDFLDFGDTFTILKKNNVFLKKITDYDILKYLDTEREDLLNHYLLSACTKFKRVCKIDLTDRDDTLKQFNQDLDEDIIEILATGEVYYWLNPKVLNSENLKNVLNTKDFSLFSPADLLKKLQTLRDSMYKEFRQNIINYSYDTAKPLI